MTMGVACRFPEGVALIAGSRATWTGGVVTSAFEYRLQKILPLGRKVGLAYAGDDIRVPENPRRPPGALGKIDPSTFPAPCSIQHRI